MTSGAFAMARLAVAAAVLLLAGACTSLVDRVVAPVDQVPRMEWQPAFAREAGIEFHSFVTGDGVRIAYRRVPAAERRLEYGFTRTATGARFRLSLGYDDPRPLPVRGTVILLHGWSLDGSTMVPWALALSERGLQAVAMDLRNHGRSGDAPAGYGIREARDVAALVGELRRRGRLEPPVYLLGVSYGAATAIFAEPLLRGDIAAIVAMQSYANAADVIASAVTGAASGNDLRSWGVRLFGGVHGDADVQAAIDRAGARLALDLGRIDVAAALVASRTCTLLVHGRRDRLVPVDVARRLAEASTRAVYVELPQERHVTLPVRVDWLAAPIAEWLEHAAARDGCPRFVLPPDPAG